MRRTIASVTTPGRWRRRRTARMVLAAALVVAAPFVGRSDPAETTGPPPGVAASVTAAPDGGPARHVRVVPVALADPAVADLLQPGDLVDLVSTIDAGTVPEVGSSATPLAGHPPADAVGHAAADAAGHGAEGDLVVARAARVRDTPAGRSGARSVLVEVPEELASHLAATAATSPLAVVVHG
ncbi:hypothetical protein [Dietzia cinnamea]|uniref:hypothetical protein n=1 Tax=Dietzia cinnamea TaxID=321318 RepID=UPI0007BB3995|nr:hypothetical protein [Dietzia cinnamea]KZO60041.1 hypothetical protein A2U19_03735 [Dietzia maris]MCT2059998.1 hypothetical protein [Dietzia cinnamea]MCT2063177.1 hypothetical protein [Dietzia cinnamea]MCT2100065.1 hypothetical protein [Dietzia cinnamea]MCT2141140.1 hypothetical protein [Dietzia cinnamea]